MRGRSLDINEFLKIVNISYLDLENDEIDIDSNINLHEAFTSRKAIGY